MNAFYYTLVWRLREDETIFVNRVFMELEDLIEFAKTISDKEIVAIDKDNYLYFIER